MFSKCLRAVTSLSRNIGRHNKLSKIMSNQLHLSPVTSLMRTFRTSSALLRKDPFEELLKIIHSNQAELPKGKIFSKDPPISIKDLDGNPIEPVDIDAWKDPKELLGLFGNIDYLERKVRSRQNDPIIEPLEDLSRLIHEEISSSLGAAKTEIELDKKGDETVETKPEVEAMDNSKQDELQQSQTIKVSPTDSKQTSDKVTSSEVPNKKETN